MPKLTVHLVKKPGHLHTACRLFVTSQKGLVTTADKAKSNCPKCVPQRPKKELTVALMPFFVTLPGKIDPKKAREIARAMGDALLSTAEYFDVAKYGVTDRTKLAHGYMRGFVHGSVKVTHQ